MSTKSKTCTCSLAALTVVGLYFIAAATAVSRDVVVADETGLRNAISWAKPGDRIVLMPGEYRPMKQTISNGGEPGNPIILSALEPAQTIIRSDTVELFKLNAPYWIFQKLSIIGSDDTNHAVHIAKNADHVILRGNRFLNFHAAIKGNPQDGHAPDHVTIERNIFINDALRETNEPTHPIDVVGGDGWILRENFIADFGKSGRDSVSYAAFLKAGSRNGLMERNLVICELRHAGARRSGLSFGGGGGAAHKRTANNAEHDSGIMRNNIIINCPNGPGIYLNRSRNSKVYNNTLYNTYGIMARFSAEISETRNNIVSGAVTGRDGAKLATTDDLTTGWGLGTYIPGLETRLIKRISNYHIKYSSLFDANDIEWTQNAIARATAWLGRSRAGRGVSQSQHWFVAPQIANFDLAASSDIIAKGKRLPEVQDDFCGNARTGSNVDLGAIEYSNARCDVRVWLDTLLQPFE